VKIDRKRLAAALKRFKSVSVAVVGDLLADVYVYARPVGLSREAPVMVMREESRKILPGGAANAANNVLELSGSALCIGVVGGDSAGRHLRAHLARRGADVSGVVSAARASTCTKTRVLAGDLHTVKQQVFRIDNQPHSRMRKAVETRVLTAIDRAAASADAWLVSDYDGDLLSERVIDRLNSLSADGRIVVVDSHSRLSRFSGISCATPNEAEASLESGIDITDSASALDAARRIREDLDAAYVFVTRGNRGMTLAGPRGWSAGLPIVGPAEIVDVAGAGDTVSAVAALALAAGEDPLTAGLLASYAASVVCMKTGVATASPSEILRAIEEYPLPKGI